MRNWCELSGIPLDGVADDEVVSLVSRRYAGGVKQFGLDVAVWRPQPSYRLVEDGANRWRVQERDTRKLLGWVVRRADEWIAYGVAYGLPAVRLGALEECAVAAAEVWTWVSAREED